MRGTGIARRLGVTLECVLADPRLTSPAPEILAHLARQPRRQDSIDGIRWGVLDTCIRNLASKIPETVAELVEWGYLEKKRSSLDGKILYHVSPVYLSTLQQRPPPNCTPDDDE
jgi:hypothetical protein